MKPVSLPVKKATLKSVLQKAGRGQIVFLTEEGEVRFAVSVADDLDLEVAALRNNPDFMAYLAACKERAHSRPMKSLVEMRELYCKPARRRKKSKRAKKP